MSTLREVLRLRAPAALVWDAVRDFGAVSRRLVPGFVTEAHLDGNARVLTFANGSTAREEIVSLLPDEYADSIRSMMRQGADVMRATLDGASP